MQIYDRRTARQTCMDSPDGVHTRGGLWPPLLPGGNLYSPVPRLLFGGLLE